MFNRRSFLKSSSIVSMAPVLPHVLGRTACAARAAADDSVLVVIQLDGGNDGLNTIVPYASDEYALARKKLRMLKKDVLQIDEHVGFHSSMKAAKELFDDGMFSVVQGVGYPNPDRSHFRSMKIWQTASFDDAQHDNNGWLGRALDHRSFAGKKNAVFVGREDTPVALWGRKAESVSLSRAEDLHLALNPSISERNLQGNGLEQFISKQVLSAYASAKDFQRQDKGQRQTNNEAVYPATRLGSQMKLVSQLLKSGSRTRVFYTSQGGYDTHSAQQNQHANLLREYAGALKAFLQDLETAGLDDRVCVLTFSEFGRRVQENDSAGTDHGTAGPVFLAGSPIKGGLLGESPDLANLIDGDLKVQYDFRSIYASILDQWLGVDSAKVLGEKFQQLDLFA